MALLRTESQEVYTSIKQINRLIAPNEIGTFLIDSSTEKLASKPLRKIDAQNIDDTIPQKMKVYAKKKGAPVSTGGITIWKGNDLHTKKLLQRSKQPHINHGPEVKFMFSGSIIYHCKLKNFHFSLLLSKGDWIYMDGKTEHGTYATADYFFTFVNFLSLPFDEFLLHQEFTKTKMKHLL